MLTWLSNKYILRILCTLGMLCLFAPHLKSMEGEGEHQQEEHTETPISGGSQEGKQPPPGEETSTPTEEQTPVSTGTTVEPQEPTVTLPSAGETSAAEFKEEIEDYREGIASHFNSLGLHLTIEQVQEQKALESLLTAAEQALQPLDQQKISAIFKVIDSYARIVEGDPESDTQEIFNTAYTDLQALAKVKLDSTLALAISAISETLKTRAASEGIAVSPTREQSIGLLLDLLSANNTFEKLLEKPTLSLKDKQVAAAEFNKIAAKLDAYSSVINPDLADTVKEYRDDFENSKNQIISKYNVVLMEPKDIQATKTTTAHLEETVARNKVALIDELKDVLSSKRNALQKSVASILDTISSMRVKIGEAIQQFWEQNISAGSSILESIMNSLGSLKTTVSDVVSDTTIPENIQETLTELLYETAAATLSAVSTVKSGIDAVANPLINTFYNQVTTYTTDAQTTLNNLKSRRK